MRRWLYALLVSLGTLAGVAAGQSTMTAHFIDVGQAHASLLEFPCGAMLVDAGSDEQHGGALVGYLTKFFQRRTDLNRTLDVVLITHNHRDHSQSLREVVEAFTVKRYFDNGFTEGSGVANPNWLKREVTEGHRSVAIREITDDAVEGASGHRGLTDGEIDPFNCTAAGVDPEVRILSAAKTSNPGWPEGDFGNQNNHSLVTRIDFKQASFLFMGDLEEAGIEILLDRYGGTPTGELDADVLQVGHHGSHNATSKELIAAVKPTLAVIPMGPWTFGQGSASPFTTFAYGHPADLGRSADRCDRPQAAAAQVGDARRKGASVSPGDYTESYHRRGAGEGRDLHRLGVGRLLLRKL